MNEFLEACCAAIGAANVLTAEAEKAPFLTDWRRRFTGRALAVVKPASSTEVAAIVALCAAARVPVVPQGGNTGLVLGSVPDASGDAIVVSLLRLNRVLEVDLLNNTMTVQAGCILQNLQDAAADAGRLFPLSLGAEGSCTIGGNLATNAGGTAVLRYGNARELCLGLEVVTAQGEVWDGLRGLRKDNTGYDLRDLFIGAEGTLGIITAAVVKLFPIPLAQVTSLAAMNTPADALALLTIAQKRCGASLTGFELMSQCCLELVSKHYPDKKLPFAEPSPQYVLLELSDNESEEHAMALLEAVITEAIEEGVIHDALVAGSIAQSRALWDLREHITLAQADEGKNIKHDVSVPISRIAEFISSTDALLEKDFPGMRMVTFGHLGDGNLHYNISAPPGMPGDDFVAQQDAINLVVHDSVVRYNGSISAEHGLGAMKRDEIRRYKSPLEMRLMETIKQALDPLNIMNPGKML
ncbi:MAG: FAD-binding oxidoreductase [Janthinobacterium lividum]